MSWSLETLDLRLDMEQEGDPTAFAVEGEIHHPLSDRRWLIDYQV